MVAVGADQSLLERLVRLDPAHRDAILAAIPLADRLAVLEHWRVRARPAQLAPDQRGADADADWRVWLILAGRGFGKTRAGAEWVQQMALDHPGCRIGLVGATAHDVDAVMVGGESGIRAVARAGFAPVLRKSARELRWPNGSVAQFFSAVEPDSLRGPQFHFAWCDELAAWPKPEAVWDNLRMGLRLGDRPRVVVTTTPRPIGLLRQMLADPVVSVSRGSTTDNRANLPAAFIDALGADPAATAKGRQEVLGEMVEDQPGALWSRDLIERCRHPVTPALARVVVGVDPPAGPGGCGIVVAGLDDDGVAHVLADASVRDATPDVWARAVASAAERFEADRVVAEINNGGAMVERVLRAAAVNLPLKNVRATRGKSARAEPVAALFAAGRVRMAGGFPALEDEMCGLIAGGGYVGPGNSPDRADAMVWALTELLLGERRAPGLRALL